jgi:hypothetical protein
MAKPSQRGSGPQSGTGPNGSASQRDPKDGSDDVLTEALRRADEAWLAERNNVAEGRDCQKFYAGDQWDVKAKQMREKDGRPVLTVNMLPQFVKQMTGDVRKSPPSIKVMPAGGKASKETAEGYTGIIRNIEQQSQAKDCYIKAVENAAQAGQGAWEVVTEYSSDDAFEQDIRIRPILDPFGVLIDPFCQLLDKSDMRYAFKFDYITVEDFKKEYPGKAVVGAPGGVENQTIFPWKVNDVIRIAEYWRRIPVKKTLYLMPDGTVLDDAKLEQETPEVQAVIQQGVDEGAIKTRNVDAFKVEKFIISGADKLSGPHAWAGRFIPICVAVGEETTMEGSTVRKGMIHDARDPQRIYNYTRSASVEAVALQPKSPFMVTQKQVEGREGMWAKAGSSNMAYLVFNPDSQNPGEPKRSPPPIASTGLDSQAMIASEDIKRVTGIYDASLGSRSNETSGVAINARQQEGDTATFLYPDNLGRAIGYCGKILVDLIPRIYDNQRQVRILKEDGTAEMLPVNQGKGLPPGAPPPIDEQTGKPKPLYDLSDGEYDVAVTVGPTFATQRAEAVANMVEIVRADPRMMPLIGDLLISNMDWPGADEMAKRLRKANGIPEEGEPPPEPPPPPPDLIADVEKTHAETRKIDADAEGKKLENMTMMAQLQAMGMQMNAMLQMFQGGQMPPQQMLAGGAPMGGPPGMSPPGAPMPAPPPAPPGMGPADVGAMSAPPINMDAGGVNQLPPMVEVGGDDLPPMVEVG